MASFGNGNVTKYQADQKIRNWKNLVMAWGSVFSTYSTW
jgi:hypothetical protein